MDLKAERQGKRGDSKIREEGRKIKRGTGKGKLLPQNFQKVGLLFITAEKRPGSPTGTHNMHAINLTKHM